MLYQSVLLTALNAKLSVLHWAMKLSHEVLSPPWDSSEAKALILKADLNKSLFLNSLIPHASITHNFTNALDLNFSLLQNLVQLLLQIKSELPEAPESRTHLALLQSSIELMRQQKQYVIRNHNFTFFGCFFFSFTVFQCSIFWRQGAQGLGVWRS